MCSVAEEDVIAIEDVVCGSDNTIDLLCKKCALVKPVIRLQKKHCYCRNCFLNAVTHKFRSTLGKTKLMKPQERVLVGFLGDQNSVALLHLLKRGMEEMSHKKIIFHPVVLFVDESICSQERHEETFAEVIETLKRIGFECYVTKLSSLYDSGQLKRIEDVDISNHITSNERDIQLRRLLDATSSNTSKIDFLKKLRHRLFFQAARALNCNKIFTSECGTDLSINLLLDVALGRGSQIPVDVAVCDKKIPDIYLIRPLREITVKEIAFYNVFNGIETSLHHRSFLMIDSSSSLQEETKSFVYQLQEEFPSTVYTICNTGDKLKIAENSVEENTCCLCFNTVTSSAKDNHISNGSAASDACRSCKCDKKRGIVSLENLTSVLCDSCRKIFINVESIENLPASILDEMKNRIFTDNLKKQIEDCLL